MKFPKVLLIAVALIATVFTASARNPLAPDAILQGNKNELQDGATFIVNGDFVLGTTGTFDATLGTYAPTGNIEILTSKSLTIDSGATLPLAGILTNTGSINTTTGTVKSGTVVVGVPFMATATLTSAAAATPVSLIADAAVPAGKKAYITSAFAIVDGGTLWATTATVKIQDTNGTPVDFVTYAVAGLGANAKLDLATANVTVEAAVKNGTGGTAAKGLQIVGNANGTGSDLKVVISGFIK